MAVTTFAPTAAATSGIRDPEGKWRAPRNWSGSLHTGVDIVLRASHTTNEPYAVHAFASGVVAYARPNGAYGNVVIIDHLNGCYSLYAHLTGKPFTPIKPTSGDQLFVQLGVTVVGGQVIGYMKDVKADTDSSGNAQLIGDATARTQLHFALFEAPTGRSSTGSIKPTILPSDSAYVDPTPLLALKGIR